jgi:uncharacterized protein
MIAIADLVKESHLPGNYFAPDAYVQGDLEFGLIENRKGDRLLAIPEALIQGIFSGLEEEVGPSAGIVLFQWGFRWGKNFYRRFAEEVRDYYDKPLAQMELVEFMQCLKQCWKTHGWGLLELDLTAYQQGFLVIKLENAPFAKFALTSDKPMGFVEAGILSAFFSQLTGRDLHCAQTTCESMGAKANDFVLGLAERLKPIDGWIAEGHNHSTIMERLCRNQASKS